MSQNTLKVHDLSEDAEFDEKTLRITMLLMFALFGVMFWAIWSDLITVFSYLDSITECVHACGQYRSRSDHNRGQQ